MELKLRQTVHPKEPPTLQRTRWQTSRHGQQRRSSGKPPTSNPSATVTTRVRRPGRCPSRGRPTGVQPPAIFFQPGTPSFHCGVYFLFSHPNKNTFLAWHAQNNKIGRNRTVKFIFCPENQCLIKVSTFFGGGLFCSFDFQYPAPPRAHFKLGDPCGGVGQQPFSTKPKSKFHSL